MTENQYDVVVIGASLGGMQAAISACMRGKRVYLSEEYDWVGGQMTTQAVPPDENHWIETQGGTRRYHEYRRQVRAHYQAMPTATEEIKQNDLFWTGESWVSRLAHEPTVAAKILTASLRPYIRQGLLALDMNTVLVAARTEGNRVTAVMVKNTKTGEEKTVTGRYFLDGTEMGDLLPLCGAEYVCGAESRAQTGEPGAPEQAAPHDLQPVTWVAALEWDEKDPGEMEKPAQYDEYAALLLPGRAGQGGCRQLGWEYFSDATHDKTGWGMLDGEYAPGRQGMWTYRRIVSAHQFTDHPNDVTLLNCSMNDYYGGNLMEDPRAQEHREQARELTRCVVWWLRNDAPHMDGSGKKGYPVKLCPRVMGTEDGLAKAPYVRESRRIQALYTIPENDMSKLLRDAPKVYEDSVGVGHYAMDLHTTTQSHSSRYAPTYPFEIPLGALIPVRMENLLPACKNLGTTHLTNGCYRLHPVEWNIGDSAGYLKDFCVEKGVTPRQVREDAALLHAFQTLLEDEGVQLHWHFDEMGQV